eukprot:3781127-Amphidinium_carterae.1
MADAMNAVDGICAPDRMVQAEHGATRLLSGYYADTHSSNFWAPAIEASTHDNATIKDRHVNTNEARYCKRKHKYI